MGYREVKTSRLTYNLPAFFIPSYMSSQTPSRRIKPLTGVAHNPSLSFLKSDSHWSPAGLYLHIRGVHLRTTWRSVVFNATLATCNGTPPRHVTATDRGRPTAEISSSFLTRKSNLDVTMPTPESPPGVWWGFGIAMEDSVPGDILTPVIPESTIFCAKY